MPPVECTRSDSDSDSTDLVRHVALFVYAVLVSGTAHGKGTALFIVFSVGFGSVCCCLYCERNGESDVSLCTEVAIALCQCDSAVSAILTGLASDNAFISNYTAAIVRSACLVSFSFLV